MITCIEGLEAVESRLLKISLTRDLEQYLKKLCHEQMRKFNVLGSIYLKMAK